MSQTIDVSALEAASLLLNQGTGCGRWVRERRQLLSFCLEGKEKWLKPQELEFLFFGELYFEGFKSYLQTSVHEVHLQLPSLPVSRDTSHTRYPA